MIITCENCQKRYLVRDNEIGMKGRKVRCVACEYQWWQNPLEESFAVENDLDLENVTHIPNENNHNTSTFSWGWGIFILAISLLLCLAYFGRQEIVHLWPKTEYLYESVGVEVALHGAGLKIENISPQHFEKDSKTLLILRGDIVNTSSVAQIIPALKIQLLGPCPGEKIVNDSKEPSKRCVLKEWRHDFAESRLLPGERMAFETQPEATMANVTNFRVQF